MGREFSLVIWYMLVCHLQESHISIYNNWEGKISSVVYAKCQFWWPPTLNFTTIRTILGAFLKIQNGALRNSSHWSKTEIAKREERFLSTQIDFFYLVVHKTLPEDDSEYYKFEKEMLIAYHIQTKTINHMHNSF